MSKYIEAMNSITFTMHFRVKPKYLGHVEDKNIDLMYELAEKASPMKPENDFLDQDIGYDDWHCPRCGKHYQNSYPMNYCCHCGQAIDWSNYGQH